MKLLKLAQLKLHQYHLCGFYKKTIVMTPHLQQFYFNWLAKADSYNENVLANHYDKFTSLYVVFNALYMEVMTELTISGNQIPKDFKDKKAATDYVIQYLKSKYYIDELLNDQESIDCLNTICEIIVDEKFHIILNWGNHQRNLDLKLLGKLTSNSNNEKGKAILSLFYHIRCNLFHGHKRFEEPQKELLIPVNKLLRKTVEITFQKLTIDINPIIHTN